MTALTWIGIALCLSQSACFSGLNLAMLGVSRLRLEAMAATGNADAVRLLSLRRDANFLLTTILWGNVAVNCGLTILADSVMAGLAAFLFSTVGITLAGEIAPQAYFSRNALRIGAMLVPFLRVYQILLFPIAKPTALILDVWLGKEGVSYMEERDLREMIKHHVAAGETEINYIEGTGAMNFLAMDDVPICEEGEPLDPASIVPLAARGDLGSIPEFEPTQHDPFIQQLAASGKKWVILTQPDGRPRWVLHAGAFLAQALTNPARTAIETFCHTPIVIDDPATPLGDVLRQFRVEMEHRHDDVIDKDVVLLWCAQERRIVTGADILGRLLRGIAAQHPSGGTAARS